MQPFLSKYKKDLLCLLGITIIFLICSVLFFGYFGSLFYDTGREIYIPQLILEGKVLYKDIFALYNPLSYEINSFLYLIFGTNVNVLYSAGIINSFLIILCIYLISRQFLNRLNSFVISVFTIFYFIFNSNTIINYIFPYAYAMIYALTAMLYSALFGLIYIRNNKSVYIISAFFMLGLSFANKPEFIFCIIPLICLLFKNKTNLKVIIASITAFITPIIISYEILFIQGFTVQNLTEYLKFIRYFFATTEQKIYNTNTFRDWSLQNIITVSIDFIQFVILTVVPAFIFNLFRAKKYVAAGIILALLLFKPYYITISKLTLNSALMISWVCIACLIIAIKSLKDKNWDFLFLCVFAILSCLRYKFILLADFAKFAGILPFALIWIYINKTLFTQKIQYSLSIILLGLCTAITQYQFKQIVYVPVELRNKNEIVYTLKAYAEPFLNTISWIKKNTKNTDTILAIPEGIMINYATERPTLPMYYHLIPNHIAALNEHNIIDNINKNQPEYFVLNNLDYSSYGSSHICENFGQNLCNFIYNNYTLVQEFESEKIKIKIFKHNL